MLYNSIINIDPSIDLNCVATYSKQSTMTVFSNMIKRTLHARSQVADMLRLGQDRVVADVVQKIYLKDKKYIQIANEHSMDVTKVRKLGNLIKKSITTSILFSSTSGHTMYSLSEQKDSSWRLGIDIQTSSFLESLVLIDRIKRI